MRNKLDKNRELFGPEANQDELYGPYTSVKAALVGIPIGKRVLGRTVGVITNGDVDEYWFEKGIKDSDLVAKGGGGGTTGDYIPLSGTEEGNPVTGHVMVTDRVAIQYYDPSINEDSAGIYFYRYGNLGSTKVLSLGGEVYNNGGVYNNFWQFDFNTTKKRAGHPEDMALPGLEVITSQNAVENETGTVGVGLFSNDDYTDIYPANKLIYAQRSYVDKANSYSTDEILTGGTWIDDKPIYRKVILGTMGSDSVPTWVLIGDLNIETMVDYKGMIKGVSNPNDWINMFSPTFSGDAMYFYFAFPNGIGLYPKTNSVFYNKDFYLIIEYTKTTDVVA